MMKITRSDTQSESVAYRFDLRKLKEWLEQRATERGKQAGQPGSSASNRQERK